jgi:hypothetical protein
MSVRRGGNGSGGFEAPSWRKSFSVYSIAFPNRRKDKRSTTGNNNILSNPQVPEFSETGILR